MKNNTIAFYGIDKEEGILFTVFWFWFLISENPYTFQVRYKNFSKQGFSKVYECTLEGDDYYDKTFAIGPFEFSTIIVDNNEKARKR